MIYKLWALSILCILVGETPINGQIQKPQTPQFRTYTPITLGSNTTQSFSNRYELNSQHQRMVEAPQKRLAEQAKVDQRTRELIQQQKELQKDKVYLKQRSQAYKQSFEKIIKEVAQKENWTIKELVFVVENTYLKGKLDYKVYEGQINKIAQFLKTYTKLRDLDWSDYDARQSALIHYFSKSFKLENGQIHIAPSYDHENPFGEGDQRKTFVSKLLEENSGQCYSLPLLYKILADEIKVDAQIALAPNHSYIKFKDSKGAWYNYETTGKGFPSDKWIITGLNVPTMGANNGIYMKGLSQSEMKIYLLVTLLEICKEELGQIPLIKEYASYCIKQNPKSIRAWALLSNYETIILRKDIYERGIKDPNNLPEHPNLYQRHLKLMDLYQKMDNLGYGQMSEEEYQEILNHKF